MYFCHFYAGISWFLTFATDIMYNDVVIFKYKERYIMIRFILVATFVILFLILSIPLLLIEWIIGKFNMDLKDRSSQIGRAHV